MEIGDLSGKARCQDLIEFIDRNFLTQVVNQPTREGNTLDLVLTNVPRYVAEVKVNPTSLSDHSLVEIQLGFNMTGRKKSETSKVDPNSFRAVDYQYQKVFSNPMSADIDECMRSQGLPQDLKSGFNELSFTRQDIIEALGELDPYSAAPDGESPARILTACKEQLADPLTLLWQESFSSGYIPAELNTQYITPIYKKGDRTDPENYNSI